MSEDTRELSLLAVRRMMEGVVPPAMCTASVDGVPHVNYLSLVEYVDLEHIALSYQFFNRSRENALATRRASVSLDDPYTGAGVVLQLEYIRSETSGPIFERLRARLAGVASHSGMEKLFFLKGADVYRVLEIRRVPGRKELPAAAPRVDLATNSRALSERLASCEDQRELLDTALGGLDELLRIDHSMLWWIDSSRECMVLLASHGYSNGGIGAEIPFGDGLAGIAAREGVPIRVGHMMNMATYGRAVRDRAAALGLTPIIEQEIPLPGLTHPRSQLAVPLRARGCVLGVLFVESEHDQYFSYDDEDALMLLGGQLALGLTLLEPIEADEPPAVSETPAVPSGQPLRVRRYARDNSVFLDGHYLIKGVAGAILWTLVSEVVATGRREFTNRELRLSRELTHAGMLDNLEVRLALLLGRLRDHGGDLQITKTGRGRFRLNGQRTLVLEDMA